MPVNKSPLDNYMSNLGSVVNRPDLSPPQKQAILESYRHIGVTIDGTKENRSYNPQGPVTAQGLAQWWQETAQIQPAQAWGITQIALNRLRESSKRNRLFNDNSLLTIGSSLLQGVPDPFAGKTPSSALAQLKNITVGDIHFQSIPASPIVGYQFPDKTKMSAREAHRLIARSLKPSTYGERFVGNLARNFSDKGGVFGYFLAGGKGVFMASAMGAFQRTSMEDVDAMRGHSLAESIAQNIVTPIYAAAAKTSQPQFYADNGSFNMSDATNTANRIAHVQAPLSILSDKITEPATLMVQAANIVAEAKKASNQRENAGPTVSPPPAQQALEMATGFLSTRQAKSFLKAHQIGSVAHDILLATIQKTNFNKISSNDFLSAITSAAGGINPPSPSSQQAYGTKAFERAYQQAIPAWQSYQKSVQDYQTNVTTGQGNRTNTSEKVSLLIARKNLLIAKANTHEVNMMGLVTQSQSYIGQLRTYAEKIPFSDTRQQVLTYANRLDKYMGSFHISTAKEITDAADKATTLGAVNKEFEKMTRNAIAFSNELVAITSGVRDLQPRLGSYGEATQLLGNLSNKVTAYDAAAIASRISSFATPTILTKEGAKGAAKNILQTFSQKLFSDQSSPRYSLSGAQFAHVALGDSGIAQSASQLLSRLPSLGPIKNLQNSVNTYAANYGTGATFSQAIGINSSTTGAGGTTVNPGYFRSSMGNALRASAGIGTNIVQSIIGSDLWTKAIPFIGAAAYVWDKWGKARNRTQALGSAMSGSGSGLLSIGLTELSLGYGVGLDKTFSLATAIGTAGVTNQDSIFTLTHAAIATSILTGLSTSQLGSGLAAQVAGGGVSAKDLAGILASSLSMGNAPSSSYAAMTGQQMSPTGMAIAVTQGAPLNAQQYAGVVSAQNAMGSTFDARAVADSLNRFAYPQFIGMASLLGVTPKTLIQDTLQGKYIDIAQMGIDYLHKSSNSYQAAFVLAQLGMPGFTSGLTSVQASNERKYAKRKNDRLVSSSDYLSKAAATDALYHASAYINATNQGASGLLERVVSSPDSLAQILSGNAVTLKNANSYSLYPPHHPYNPFQPIPNPTPYLTPPPTPYLTPTPTPTPSLTPYPTPTPSPTHIEGRIHIIDHATGATQVAHLSLHGGAVGAHTPVTPHHQINHAHGTVRP